MTPSRLERSVARRTGDPLSVIRRLGFQARPGRRDELEAENLHLAVRCPFCGADVPLPSAPCGPPALAGCGRCDVEFEYAAAELFAAGPGLGTRPHRRVHSA
ncbi:hypothetical protein [Paludisphaera mucosa]|uniref:Uncharacterized protein n=1 Tax=Paludisphaera mucosa TaxID=3030827 RepID=A0ABT6FCX0_9BACT|nr:hypothetical protein [Paludisphaera mucosa]MDG3005431.1 hypothetical protein [Paludisphaera mucosa]